MAVVCFIVMLVPIGAWADEAEDVSGAPDWAPAVTAAFDATSYDGADRMVLTVAGTNDGPAIIRDVDFDVVVPQGFYVVSGSASKHLDAIAPGERVEMQLALSQSVPAPTTFARTGDGLAGLAVGLVLVVVGALAIAVAVGYFRKGASRLLSVVLVGTLAVGMVPVVHGSASADEVASGAVLTVGSAEATTAVDGVEVGVVATMAVATADELPETTEATLEALDAVAANAVSAHVEIRSDLDFAAQVSPEHLTLGDGLTSCEVVSIERVDDNTIVLVLAGLAGTGDDYGTVEAAAGAFADTAATGFGIVPVSQPHPFVSDVTDIQSAGYVDGSFVLSLYLDCAEFIDNPVSTDFSLPANPAIAVESVGLDGRNVVNVALSVPGETTEEQFEALDTALTEGGIVVAASATNCGALTSTAGGSSALEYVDALPVATARVENVQEGGDGSLAFDFVVDLSALNGAVALDDASDVVLREPDGLQSDDCEIVDATPKLMDDNTLLFPVTVPVPSGESTSLLQAIGDANGDGTIDGVENAVVQEALAWTLSGHELELKGDALINAWGIPQNGTTVALTLADSAQPASASARDASTAATSLELCQTALSSIGYFVSAFAMSDPGAFFQGAGSVFGFIAKSVGLSEEELVTLQDVMDQLNRMDTELRTVDTKVSALSQQLNDMERRQDYAKDVRSLQGLIGRISAYSPLVAASVSKLDDVNKDAAKFSELSEGDQKKMRSLAVSTEALRTISGSSAFDDTIKLGDLITGESTIGAKSIVEEYDQWHATYYNWEPETYDARQNFMARVGSAYVMGYAAAMAQLEVKIADEKDADKIAGYRAAEQQLVSGAGRVVEVLRGTKGTDGKLVESPLLAKTHARSDGAVLNLVNGRLFNQASFSSNIYGDLATFTKKDIDNVSTYVFDGSLTRADFEEMARRLPAVKKLYPSATTIRKELELWQLQPNKSVQQELSKTRYTAFVDEVFQTNRFIVSDATRKRTKNKRSVRHTYTYYGDYFDIDANRTVTGAELYKADNKYHSSKVRWYTTCTLHNIMVAKAK